MGPMAMVFAWDTLRHEPNVAPQVVDPGIPRVGTLDVLVGVDGSPASAAAVRAAVRLFEHSLGRMTLATVIPRGEPAGSPDERAARMALQRQGVRVRAHQPAVEVFSANGLRPALVVLRGNPAHELAAAAADGGYDVLVVGSRGAGITKFVLGSVAKALAAGCSVPALVVGSAPEDVGPVRLGTTSSALGRDGGAPLQHAPR
jgi:nucleotide-binding universal stress UspA family protein